MIRRIIAAVAVMAFAVPAFVFGPAVVADNEILQDKVPAVAAVVDSQVPDAEAHVTAGYITHSSSSELTRVSITRLDGNTQLLARGSSMYNGHYVRNTQAGCVLGIFFNGIPVVTLQPGQQAHTNPGTFYSVSYNC